MRELNTTQFPYLRCVCTERLPPTIAALSTDVASRLRSLSHKGTLAIDVPDKNIVEPLVFGAWQAGWCVMMLPSLTDPTEIAYWASQTKIDALFLSKEKATLADGFTSVAIIPLRLEAGIDAIRDWLTGEVDGQADSYQWQDEECALVLPTSGTTGRPKGICHSLPNIIHSSKRFIESFGISARDRLLITASLHTMSGFRCSITVPYLSRCSAEQHDVTGIPLRLLPLTREHRSTVVVSGPSLVIQLSLLAERLRDELTSIRLFLSTGAPLARSNRDRLASTLGVPVLDYYGLTETGGIVVAQLLDRDWHGDGSLGTPCQGVDACLVSGARTGRGELRIRCGSLYLGYLGDTMVVRKHYDTGDLVEIHDDGRITWIERIDKRAKGLSGEWLNTELLRHWLQRQNHVSNVTIEIRYDEYQRTQIDAEIQGIPAEAWNEWRQVIYRKICSELNADYHNTRLHRSKDSSINGASRQS